MKHIFLAATLAAAATAQANDSLYNLTVFGNDPMHGEHGATAANLTLGQCLDVAQDFYSRTGQDTMSALCTSQQPAENTSYRVVCEKADLDDLGGHCTLAPAN